MQKRNKKTDSAITTPMSLVRAQCKKLVLTSNGEASKSKLGLESKHLLDGVLGGHDDGVGNESVLVLLDLLDHLGLLLGGAVVVDDTNTTEKSHSDGHLGLGDSVHGGGHKRSLEGDLLGQSSLERDLVGGEINLAGEHEEIVVGQATSNGRVHQAVDVKAILLLVGLEEGHGVLGVFVSLGHSSRVVVVGRVPPERKTRGRV